MAFFETICMPAGLLQPVLEDMHSAGKVLELPFLAYADVQPAACLLILLEVPSTQTPEGEYLSCLCAKKLHLVVLHLASLAHMSMHLTLNIQAVG